MFDALFFNDFFLNEFWIRVVQLEDEKDLESLGNLKFSRDAAKKLGVKPWLGALHIWKNTWLGLGVQICEACVMFTFVMIPDDLR